VKTTYSSITTFQSETRTQSHNALPALLSTSQKHLFELTALLHYICCFLQICKHELV
jgi:hypothetical protein